MEGDTFTYSYLIRADPQPDSFTWTRDTVPFSSTERIALTVDSISISSVSRSDSGVYIVTASNVAGSGSTNFTLNVYCKLYTQPYVSTLPFIL